MEFNLTKLDKNNISKLLNLSFNYYDLSNNSFDDLLQDYIDNSQELKPLEIRTLIKFLIDLIGKDLDSTSIKDSLTQISMPENFIEQFISMKSQKISSIENMKLALSRKTMKNKIENFDYSFFVKYADSDNSQVEFRVKLNFKFNNSEGKTDFLEFDMSISQFYQLMNDFSKIETIMQTLG